MWVLFTLSALLTVLPLPTFSLTILPPTDITSPLLTPRRKIQYCYNGPTTIPGTTFTTRPDVEPERPTSDWIIWCTPNTQTYVTLLYTRPLPGVQAWGNIQHNMDEAFNSTREEIKTGGDRVIRFGQWGYPQYGVAVFFDDANNHQLTWGVLGSALIAIESYMQMIRAAGAQPGSLKFDVFDGKNQVGIGTFDVE